MNSADLIEYYELLRILEKSQAKDNFEDFIRYVRPDQYIGWFHRTYYRILDMFANKKIKNLMVTIGPQLGKSDGSTRLLPAYILGKFPDLKLAECSYSTTFARKFNRDIQRIIDTREYSEIYPDTYLNRSIVNKENTSYIRTADEFEIVNHNGGLRAVGRGGPLTGNRVDVAILDDIYKDYAEANSPIIRSSVWDWYTTVVSTRLHNDSQQLMVFTRWHEEDLIGLLEEKGLVIEAKCWANFENIPDGHWVKVNFEAIKESEPTELDPRQELEVLWPERHSFEKLTATRNLDENKFQSLYQGNPCSKEGYLYSPFDTYTDLPVFGGRICNYTDTADTGTDKLCSIVYLVHNKKAYVIDVIFTDKPMEITEPMVADMLDKRGVKIAYIETNNGGRGFQRAVKTHMKNACGFDTFHQSENKESRIKSNSTTVNQSIVFPSGWGKKWPEFNKHILTFKADFKANKHDDGPDVLTGIVEKSLTSATLKPFEHDSRFR